jgi:hypothetical protein
VVRHLHSKCAGVMDVGINYSPSEAENGEFLKLRTVENK